MGDFYQLKKDKTQTNLFSKYSLDKISSHRIKTEKGILKLASLLDSEMWETQNGKDFFKSLKGLQSYHLSSITKHTESPQPSKYFLIWQILYKFYERRKISKV